MINLVLYSYHSIHSPTQIKSGYSKLYKFIQLRELEMYLFVKKKYIYLVFQHLFFIMAEAVFTCSLWVD